MVCAEGLVETVGVVVRAISALVCAEGVVATVGVVFSFDSSKEADRRILIPQLGGVGFDGWPT